MKKLSLSIDCCTISTRIYRDSTTVFRKTLLSLLLLLSFSIALQVYAAENSNLLNKYEALELLFDHFEIEIDSSYTSLEPTFQQHFRDVLPANPYYARVNTACDMDLIQCSSEQFFDGEGPISTVAFLKMFYTLKWEDNEVKQDRLSRYRGGLWYLPYWHEALGIGLIDNDTSLEQLSLKDGSWILRKDTALHFYDGIVEKYFNGLEVHTDHVIPENYYDLSEIDIILLRYDGLLTKIQSQQEQLEEEVEKEKRKRAQTPLQWFVPAYATKQ